MENTINRRERKKLQVLNALVNVSMKLFQEKGFDETTIVEITETADIATGTFYNYFQSKEDLLRYALSQKIDGIKSSIEELSKSPITPREKISQMLLIAGKMYEDDKQFFNFCTNHLVLKQPPHDSQFKEILVDIILEGQKNGDFRKHIPVEVVTEVFVGLMTSSINSYSQIPFMENLNYKLTLFLDGLSNK
jgi:AcrR family transcriptional regulator